MVEEAATTEFAAECSRDAVLRVQCAARAFCALTNDVAEAARAMVERFLVLLARCAEICGAQLMKQRIRILLIRQCAGTFA
jgi:hypothetical protein